MDQTTYFLWNKDACHPALFWEGSRFKIMVYDGSTHDSAYVQECRIAQHGDQTWEMYDLWYYIEDQPWGFELPDLRQIQRPDMLFYNHSLPSIMIKLGYSKNVLKKHQKKGQDIWFPFQNGMVSYMLIPLGFAGLIDPTQTWPAAVSSTSPWTRLPLPSLPNMAVAFRLRSRPAISEWTVDQAQLGWL